jgi:hypothetical protein
MLRRHLTWSLAPMVLALACSIAPACSSSDAGGDEAAGAAGAAGGGGSSGKKVDPLPLAAGCQPLLGGKDCMLPYPSDFFRVADASLPSGFRVQMGEGAKMKTSSGASADVNDWKPTDGFSKLPPIMALLGGPVSTEGLTGILDAPEPSMAAQSPTLLIEADTGALLPHFVDIDPKADDPELQALIIHPLVGLKARTRYVVALRGVKAPDGGLAAAPEGFRRLRDGDDDASLAALLARFEGDVFKVTEAAGAPRKDLQLAWDFTTGSDELVSADMLSVREQVLAWLAANKPEITITKLDEAPDPKQPRLWRTIEGTIKVPLFLDNAEVGASLHRGPDGKITQNGMADLPFLVKVPASVRDMAGPGRALAFGHGFFGSREEIAGDAMIHVADTLGTVVVGIDWWGMSSPDRDQVIKSLTGDPTTAALFTERVPQAMANWTVMTAAMRGPLAEQEALRRPATGGAPGEALYDTSNVNFLGISQGHILGGTLAAFDPDLTRICLNVGGAGVASLMFRALPFNTFLLLLDGPLPGSLAKQKFAASLQPQLDRIDPGFWAPRVLADKLPGSPADRRVLQQAGIGDTQVPNFGSFLHARLLNLPQMSPGPRAIFGLDQAPSPHDGSAFALYDVGQDDAFYKENKPAPKDNGVHGAVRIRADVLEQMDLFFRTDSQIVVSNKGPLRLEGDRRTGVDVGVAVGSERGSAPYTPGGGSAPYTPGGALPLHPGQEKRG